MHSERGAEAKAKGYEGEMCSECGNFTLVRNAHLHEVRHVRLNDGVFVIDASRHGRAKSAKRVFKLKDPAIHE